MPNPRCADEQFVFADRELLCADKSMNYSTFNVFLFITGQAYWQP